MKLVYSFGFFLGIQFLLPTEDVSNVRGKKKAKDRVTMVVCCNATGTDRLAITMIGKAKERACIRKFLANSIISAEECMD